MDSTSPTFVLKSEFVALCEGKADSVFLQKLIESAADLPDIDFLPHESFYGVSEFGNMLSAIRGARRSFAAIKGVLLIADGHDNPEETFNGIITQVTEAGGYPIPSRLAEIAYSTDGYPAVSVTIIPDYVTAGGHETLLIQVLYNRYDWLRQCVHAFLGCGQLNALEWPPEKRAKAEYHSIVAALHYRDPSRAASLALKGDKRVFEPNDPAFDRSSTVGAYLHVLTR
jgi:hypothetical protein